PESLREEDLRADAVGAAHEDRVPEVLRDLEQAAEAADLGEHPLALRGVRECTDARDDAVGGVDVDTGAAVGLGRHGARPITRRHSRARGPTLPARARVRPGPR